MLRGSVNTFRAHRPLLFLELHFDMLERRGESIAALIRRLASLGYRFETPEGAALPRWRLQR